MRSQIENKLLNKFKHVQESQAIVPGNVRKYPGPWKAYVEA